MSERREDLLVSESHNSLAVLVDLAVIQIHDCLSWSEEGCSRVVHAKCLHRLRKGVLQRYPDWDLAEDAVLLLGEYHVAAQSLGRKYEMDARRAEQSY